MFRIKICGITTPEDALLAADAGAGAIGLNFYEKSPRCITAERAREITLSVVSRGISCTAMRLFGVFVNNTLDEAGELAMKAGTLDLQFHGDEPPGMIAELATAYRAIQDLAARQFSSPQSREDLLEAARNVFSEQSTIFGQPTLPFYIPAEEPHPTSKLPTPGHPLIIRAHRGSPDSLATYLLQCNAAGGLPHAILLDAHAPGAYGGTGQTLDWASIPAQREKLLGLPLILAGGLTPDNVAEAIRLARPDAVDVASGVESSPGKKDPAKVRDFIAAAKSAFADLDPEDS